MIEYRVLNYSVQQIVEQAIQTVSEEWTPTLFYAFLHNREKYVIWRLLRLLPAFLRIQSLLALVQHCLDNLIDSLFSFG
jgi:hypothetical protein